MLGEAQEGEGDWIVVLRELPVEPLNQMVKENRHLQLRELRSRAQARAAAKRHHIAVLGHCGEDRLQGKREVKMEAVARKLDTNLFENALIPEILTLQTRHA